ncbi:Zn-ribbon domain-containing OB-fold protein [Pararhodobacter sp.]|uniref:Zn-ribbon domain-containing OB-fold protein n=1 Tax=Pararhodobacter sp. TaxID=2127056 RepID=UPI002AFED2CE|nr:zinc ribbon domain-containing protein [Pararhodobacter sp.]
MTDIAKTLETLIGMDPTLASFWQGVTEGQVMIQRCGTCGAHQFPPRPFCLECDAERPDWVVATGQGVVHSVTVSHLPPNPGQAMVLIDLKEGPRLLMQAEGAPRVGQTGAVRWAEGPSGQPVLRFRAEGAG